MTKCRRSRSMQTKWLKMMMIFFCSCSCFVVTKQTLIEVAKNTPVNLHKWCYCVFVYEYRGGHQQSWWQLMTINDIRNAWIANQIFNTISEDARPKMSHSHHSASDSNNSRQRKNDIKWVLGRQLENYSITFQENLIKNSFDRGFSNMSKNKRASVTQNAHLFPVANWDLNRTKKKTIKLLTFGGRK